MDMEDAMFLKDQGVYRQPVFLAKSSIFLPANLLMNYTNVMFFMAHN